MNVYVYLGLALLTAVSVLLSPVAFCCFRVFPGYEPDKATRLMIWVYGRAWLVLMRPFVSFSFCGFDTIPPRSAILVSNHMSFFDIFCMGALPYSNVVFTVRDWPFRIPWFAPFMRLARYINFERQGYDSGLALCKEHLERGALIHFFPEGHRSRDGALQRFHSGAFRLALETGRPVVPLCIKGTHRLLPPKSGVMSPAHISMESLSPLHPADFPGERGHIDMRRECQKRMAASLQNTAQ